MELAKKVAQATFEQIQNDINADLELIRRSIPTKLSLAAETAHDVRYVKARQASLGCEENNLCIALYSFCRLLKRDLKIYWSDFDSGKAWSS